jgi:hypothetical protein
MDTRAGERTEDLLPARDGSREDHSSRLLEDLHRSRREALVAEVSTAVGGRAPAERLVDEAFVRAWASPERVAEAPDPEAWLRRRALRLHRLPRPRPGGAPTVTPDLAELRRRGLARRRARRAAVVAVAVPAVVLTGVGAVALAGGGRSGGGGPRPTVVEPLPDDDLDELAPGTHQLVLSLSPDAPTAEVTLGPGWRAEQGVRRGTGDGVVVVLAADVDRVVRRPCGVRGRGLADVADEPGAIVAALTSAPGLAPAAPVEEVETYGGRAVHLALRVTSAGRCLDGSPSTLLVTAAGSITAPPVGSAVDAWVVTVGRRVLVVLGTRGPGASAQDTAALREALDSLVLVGPE